MAYGDKATKALIEAALEVHAARGDMVKRAISDSDYREAEEGFIAAVFALEPAAMGSFLADYFGTPKATRAVGTAVTLAEHPVLVEEFGSTDVWTLRKLGNDRRETYNIATLLRRGRDGSEERVRLCINLGEFARWALSFPRSAQMLGGAGGAERIIWSQVVRLVEEEVGE